MSPLDIELVIVCTITPDRVIPSSSCIVQHKIGAKNAVCFDLAAACSGFLYSLTCAKALIQSGVYKNALVIGADEYHPELTPLLDGSSRTDIPSDGGGAILIEYGSGKDLNLMVEFFQQEMPAFYTRPRTVFRRLRPVSASAAIKAPSMTMKGHP